jgi:toxin ParE1/3/4
VTNYTLSRRADAQLDEIFDCTLATFGLRQAKRYRDSLLNCFAMSADNPGIGRLSPMVGAGIRRHEHESHVILYRATDIQIAIVAVMHRRQRIG